MTKTQGSKRSPTRRRTCLRYRADMPAGDGITSTSAAALWSLLAGIDLLSGEVLGLVRERHRSAEFIEFLQLADQHYPAGLRIRMVMDNHSAHISRETRAYLAGTPNRFEFIFTRRTDRGST